MYPINLHPALLRVEMFFFIAIDYCSNLSLLLVVRVKRLVASVCLSVCPHGKTKTAETTIAKLARWIVHRESSPTKVKGAKVKVKGSQSELWTLSSARLLVSFGSSAVRNIHTYIHTYIHTCMLYDIASLAMN